MSAARFAAVDLGASGGRVVVGEVSERRLAVTGVHRFPNRPVRLPGGLHWDVLGLFGNVLDGLAVASRGGSVTSIGVDTWAVDYGLLDAEGALLGNPYHYRDSRTEGVPDKVHAKRSHASLHGENGLQLLPFNTIYQLAAASGTPLLAAARTVLLVPDLFVHWLTGAVGAELTNASTTGLLDVRSQQWSAALCDVIGLDRDLLPGLWHPGEVVGRLLPEVAQETGLLVSTPVTAVGSHDTASAVVAVPMNPSRAAYVSLGTWGLVGVELESPVLTEQSRQAGFTNELGVDGRVRYLRNVMGLWLLQESLRAWGRDDLGGLLSAAAQLPTGGPQFDVDDPRLLPPGDMPVRIGELHEEAGQAPPRDPAGMVRSIVDSLAAALARSVLAAADLSGTDVKVIHVVGGGSQNALLCQQLADASGLPVLAGPVEATALGNLLVQSRAHGAVNGSLEALRDLVRRAHELQTFHPRSSQ